MTPKKLQSITARAELPVRNKPYFVTIGRGLALGYRRNGTGAGAWVVRAADGKGGNWIKNLAAADDVDPANDGNVLDFLQAQDKARAFTGHQATASERPLTVAEAIDAYQADLGKRGKAIANATAARIYLTPGLAARPVSQLTAQELRTWRNGITANPATINRNLKGFKAALTEAARMDDRIKNRHAWIDGLKALPDANRAREQFLTDDQVKALIAAAYAINSSFGLFVEVAAVTGARPSQIARLEMRDLQAEAGRVTMPTSDKGRGSKVINRTPIPLPAGLVAKLQAAAAGRSPTDALVTGGGSDYQPAYRRARAAAGIADDVDFYSLRSSRIMRALKAGVPVSLIAKACDTSVAIIQSNYARHLATFAEDKLRLGLLDIDAPVASNVVALRA